jgi:hypothetical protein
MGEYDFLGRAKKVSVTSTYNQKELYKYLQQWFEERHYLVVENEYDEKISGEGKRNINFSWWLEKKAELLTKLVMELSFSSESTDTQVTSEDGTIKTVQKGTVKVSIRAFVFRDAESDWKIHKASPERTLIRELFDKIVKKPRLLKYQEQLDSDWNAVVADLKIYMNTHKFD